MLVPLGIVMTARTHRISRAIAVLVHMKGVLLAWRQSSYYIGGYLPPHLNPLPRGEERESNDERSSE